MNQVIYCEFLLLVTTETCSLFWSWIVKTFISLMSHLYKIKGNYVTQRFQCTLQVHVSLHVYVSWFHCHPFLESVGTLNLVIPSSIVCHKNMNLANFFANTITLSFIPGIPLHCDNTFQWIPKWIGAPLKQVCNGGPQFIFICNVPVYKCDLKFIAWLM